ncbi:MAG: hypothetical protein NZ840_07385 [Anaerolineales bacterium]|nr:hypothetical protein [Anaerolineales bacterium]MDW8161861.1 hypothetical protein [Anaerolineales bacterium]
MDEIRIGRLLSANNSQFLVGCHVSQVALPKLGALARVELENHYAVYGVITEISIADDGLVRQLATVEPLDEAIVHDHRLNRNVPLEIRVLSVGYRLEGRIFHLLPPQPPLGLDRLVLCSPAETVEFTASGQLGYLRHLLRDNSPLAFEVLAAHLQLAQMAHRKVGRADWSQWVIQELITWLRDDYPTLIRVLRCLADARLFGQEKSFP